MKNSRLIIVFIAGVLIGAVIYFLIMFSYNIAGQSVSNLNSQYSYTTAICNQESKECLDVLISCNDGKVIGMEPILNIVQHDINWTDPRGNLTTSYCE